MTDFRTLVPNGEGGSEVPLLTLEQIEISQQYLIGKGVEI